MGTNCSTHYSPDPKNQCSAYMNDTIDGSNFVVSQVRPGIEMTIVLASVTGSGIIMVMEQL